MPLFVLRQLWYYNHRLKDDTYMARFAILVARYKRRSYYFEVMIMIRKVGCLLGFTPCAHPVFVLLRHTASPLSLPVQLLPPFIPLTPTHRTIATPITVPYGMALPIMSHNPASIPRRILRHRS
jgi:hypothetical protein